jgi:mevalonate kinase
MYCYDTHKGFIHRYICTYVFVSIQVDQTTPKSTKIGRKRLKLRKVEKVDKVLEIVDEVREKVDATLEKVNEILIKVDELLDKEDETFRNSMKILDIRLNCRQS